MNPILFVYNLMIGYTKENSKNYPRKCFWTEEKESQIKIQPRVSANQPSTTGPSVYPAFSDIWMLGRAQETPLTVAIVGVALVIPCIAKHLCFAVYMCSCRIFHRLGNYDNSTMKIVG